MTSLESHRRMDDARARADLSVQDLWLRYVGLTGSGDAFDIDGYLQGLIPLDAFQESILGQAVNEALSESYETYRMPLPDLPPAHRTKTQRLHDLVDELLAPNPADATDQSAPGDPQSHT